MFDTMCIAKRIKQARIDKNMTQLQLADAMGVSYQAVSNWERGNSMPDISKLADLCTTLGLTVNELLGVEETATAAVTKAMEKEQLTVEELQEVAPMLPPEQVTEFVQKLEAMDQKKGRQASVDLVEKWQCESAYRQKIYGKTEGEEDWQENGPVRYYEPCSFPG